MSSCIGLKACKRCVADCLLAELEADGNDVSIWYERINGSVFTWKHFEQSYIASAVCQCGLPGKDCPICRARRAHLVRSLDNVHSDHSGHIVRLVDNFVSIGNDRGALTVYMYPPSSHLSPLIGFFRCLLLLFDISLFFVSSSLDLALTLALTLSP